MKRFHGVPAGYSHECLLNTRIGEVRHHLQQKPEGMM
jgi:hypothetical protein